jgi:protease PrsW
VYTRLVTTVAIAFVGGIVPSLVWLAFWLTEDRCQPEPKIRLIFTFIAGMATVGIVLPLEQLIAANEQLLQAWLAGAWAAPVISLAGSPQFAASALILLLWAFSEEIFKLIAAAFGLASAAYDEPLDAVIYLTTAGLGFAAAENVLYLFASLGNSTGLQSLLTGDLRFVGATLLHTLASATIGLSMAFFFHSSRLVRSLALALGVILAVGLHALFNFSILWGGGAKALYVFLPIWLGIVALLAFTERIKNPAKDYC